ncbi:COP9 signalosome complex subunit 5 protein [Rutstroemia sp. NJR-2017a BBW]|nr:COP9 signalosome complex subunit 5 protein [Rutstroemia sp. NJR-2017a BBW]
METAFKTWELDNNVQLVDPVRDALYNYDKDEQKAIQDLKPWKTDPHHFKNVRISAVALLKMVMHARSGGSIEVMGLMQGKIAGDTIIVTDAFRLPVEGTETRVNAQDEANEYMVEYLQACRDQGKLENAVGWYHSHPGYGCWLSGIDVGTQVTQQTFSDPFLAVVIDPDRTISAGKVEIGAFRTYPENYKPADSGSGDGYQTIPLAKIEDFGAHSIRQAGSGIARTGRAPPGSMANKAMDLQLQKVVRDSSKIAGEEMTGLKAGEVKAQLFNGLGSAPNAEATPAVEVTQ